MGTEYFKTKMRKGKYNLISDVPGVKVGHYTLNQGEIQTGVTIIIPSSANIFKNKLACGCHVINGFGKTSGLVQIEELGTLESYIGLTNTLSVGTVSQAIVKHMLSFNPEIGTSTGTINVVTGECNDGYLNDIRGCYIQEHHVYDAIKDARVDFQEGAIGAGRGMMCYGMKGGIGSSSRKVIIDDQPYTIGSLVLSNFGLKQDFIYHDLNVDDPTFVEKGSIMMILATDIPLDARQLKRVCKRMPIALARTGSYMGNGSGDIAIAFSTANRYPHDASTAILNTKILHESKIDDVFRTAIEAMEEAIYSSLIHSETIQGRDGHIVYSLKDTLLKE